MPPMTRARRRKIVVAALAPVILALSYLVTANVLLRTRLLRDAVGSTASELASNGRSSELTLEYGSAYSIFPGRVHVEGLLMRGRERTLEWFFTLERADVSISIFDLLRRNFHATRVRASGLAFRIRLRLGRAQATPNLVSTLPSIAGFVDPPILDDGPEPAPVADEKYDSWSVNLEDVDVEHVREIWIHSVRATGDTRVRGRWLFRPQRWLEVGPATVEANGVDLFHGKQPLASGLRGPTEATLHPFDLRRVTGAAILEHVSQDGHLRGRLNVAGVLRWIAPASKIDFERWETPFDARVIVDHGRLTNGTWVRTETSDCLLEARGLAFNSSTQSALTIDAPLVSVDSRFSGLRISERGSERARVASLALTVTSPQLQLARLFDDARFSLSVSGAATRDLSAWQSWLPSPPPFIVRSGTVTAEAHADGSIAEGRVRGAVRLSVRRLTLERGTDRFSGDITSDVRLLDASVPDAWLAATATISVDDAAAGLGRTLLAGKLSADVALRGSWPERNFDLSGSHAALTTFTARSKTGAAAILVVPSLRAGASRLVLAPTGMTGHVSVELPRADLVDVGRLQEVLALPKELRLEAGKLRASLHGDLDLPSGSLRGDGQVVARGVRFRVGSTELFGNFTGMVRARRSAGADGSTDFSASTLAIDDAGTGTANPLPAQGAWWANLAFRQTVLRWGGGFSFDTKVHLRAKDASVAVALVSQNSSVPNWAASAFRMPDLEADARLRLAPDSFEVRSLVARGGGTSLRTEYSNRNGRQDGAVLVDLGWISLGYDLAEKTGGLVFFGSDRWFSRKTASMRAAAAAAHRDTTDAEQLARYAAMTPQLRQAEAQELASSCALDLRSCDGTSIARLLRATADRGERRSLSGVIHAPLLVAAAKRGTDGTTLDTLVIGGLVEALRVGGESTLDNIAEAPILAAAEDWDATRGKVVTVSGRLSRRRDEGSYFSGLLTTGAQTVLFVTPFSVPPASATSMHFRGVFVERHTLPDPAQDEPPALVLVGAFVP